MKSSFRPHFAIRILLSICLLLLPFIPINASRRPEPVRVEPDGSFLLENVASGERRMMAGVPYGSPYFVVSTTAGDMDLSETPLEVVEDAEAGTVRVRISSRFATVSGTVGGDIRSGK